MRYPLLQTLVAFAIVLAWVHSAAAIDLGLVINIDGDNAFPADTLAESTKALRAEIDGYANAKVKTLCYSTGAGSDILLYPTRVANTWGWRKTKYDTDPAWQSRIERMRNNMAEGGDALRTAGTRAKERGMYFIPSQRMNDGHFAFGNPPEEYPLTGKFWLEHRDLVIGKSPIHGKSEYQHLLDFTHQAVRDYRLAEIFEAIDRYQDILDGFELDFTRFQVFFPEGQAVTGAPLMTELVAQVREKLSTTSKAQNRPLVLIVRVPPSLKCCLWSGLEVELWARQKLVDFVVPSQMMTTGFEQPIDEFKAALGADGPKVFAGLLSRVTVSFPFSASAAAGELKAADRGITIEQLRAAAENSYHLGADGIYLFNLSNYAALFKNGSGKTAIDLSDLSSQANKDKVFSISKAYWYDSEDGYEYRKQLPVGLDESSPKSFKLLVGEDPNTADKRWLRIGLRNPPKNARVEIALNNSKLVAGEIVSLARPSHDETSKQVVKPVSASKDLPTHFVLIALPQGAQVLRGQNTITMTLTGLAGESPTSVTDIDLGLFH
jgi:hypothetical protein